MTDSDPRYISHAAAYEAVQFGPPDFEIKTVDDVNRYLDYLMSLTKGAETLFLAGQFHLSAFAAITAIEETSRAHLSAFRKAGADRKKGRDPLRDHHHKQKAAVAVVFMGGRMHEVLGGEEAANNFHRKINNGYLNEVREKSLYCFADVGGFVRPMDFVDIEMARIILLVAIETVDDTFCGMTDHSYQVSKEFDEMFESIRGSELSDGI
ncbi:AbiV family abortive infection protein [Celeribacter halophilus]|uniref:AbiV family abortive infection protein n=1 Tax=Celeribacter halophilus TaxID=576117 RepID=A0AAW7XPQ3_9RHOB|nr:AbiV family abortive infection protein [Celeribacter halophilus]MDO6456317.1 AbiV family abortive infection protein [Celeribacter halophilus]